MPCEHATRGDVKAGGRFRAGRRVRSGRLVGGAAICDITRVGDAAIQGEVAEDWPLLADAAGGRPDALGQLYDRHAAAIYRFARSHGLAPEDAREVTRDVFVAAYEKAAIIRLAEGGSLRPWLLATCRDLCLARRAAAHHAAHHAAHDPARRHDSEAEGDRPASESAIDPAEHADEPITDEELAVALTGLEGIDRTVARMCLAEGWTHAEAAEELGARRAAAQDRLNWAVDRIRSLLGLQRRGEP